MIRSLVRDPFKSIYFLVDELGNVNHMNMLMRPNHKKLIMDYIQQLAYPEFFKFQNKIMIRQSNVMTDKLLVDFVAGIPNVDEVDIPPFIYIPSDHYTYGEIVVMEDIILRDILGFCSAFTPDLELEWDFLHMTENKMTDEQKKEKEKYDRQTKTLGALMVFLGSVMNINDPLCHTRSRLFDGFYGVPQVCHINDGSLMSSCFETSATIGMAAVDLLLKKAYPGAIDDNQGFEKNFTKRFILQTLCCIAIKRAALSGVVEYLALSDKFSKAWNNKETNEKRVAPYLYVIQQLEDETFQGYELAYKWLAWRGIIERTKEMFFEVVKKIRGGN